MHKKDLKVNLVIFLFLVLLILSFFTGGTFAQQSEDGDISFRWAFGALVEKGEGRELLSVEEEISLKTGDQLKIFLELTKECFIYLICQSSQGDISLLFPYHLDRIDEYSYADKSYYIPGGDDWFELDDRIGEESQVIRVTFVIALIITAVAAVMTLIWA